MDHEEMRLECLKLANGNTDQAADMYDFIRSRGKYSGGALKGVAPEDYPQNDKVRVVGKDGDLGPFSDYIKDK